MIRAEVKGKECKHMKKNTAFRTAAILLVLVMVTSSFVGSTFAKYTASSSGMDKARVAYWGMSAPAVMEFELFDGEYTSVDSATVSHVVAPGTSKEIYFGIVFSTNFAYGTPLRPEVDYSFLVKAEATGNYSELDANPNFKWSLAGSGEELAYYNTIDELLNAIEALDGSTSGANEYEAGEWPPRVYASNACQIGWVWEYETQGEGMAAQDKMDTEMGNMQDLENVTITITITATQID